MELKEAIYGRRSIRKFLEKGIDEKTILKIIDSAIRAPTACDRQAWKFIVIKDKRVKERIIKNGATSFIRNAPVGIVVLYNNQTDNIEYKDSIQSASAAIQNMLLTAHSLKIGCCWVNNIPIKTKLRKILKIPFNYDPIAYIAMGYYDVKPRKKALKHAPKDLISYNKFNFKEKVPSKLNLKLRIKRIVRKAYYLFPYKKAIRPIADKFEKKFE